MSLTFILGCKKSGKTEYILNSIKGINNAALIVPEQNMFFYEKTILEKLGEEKAFLLETISFKKLSRKILKSKDGFNILKHLDNDTKNLLINKILLKRKNDLKIFNKSVNKADFADRISEQITEFKKYLITAGKLNELIKNENINESLKNKISDIALIYADYEKELEDIFEDTDDLITKAAICIENNSYALNSVIFLDGFTGFTKQEYLMINSFLRNNKDVVISLPYDDERINYSDLFYTCHLTKKKLEENAREIGIEIKTINLNSCFIKSKELLFAQENLFKTNPLSYSEPVNHISIYSFKNIYLECLNAASIIIDGIKNNNTLNDYALVVPDIITYKKYLTEIFKEYNIPLYLNEKVSIAQLPVSTLCNYVLELILANNNMELLLSYLKSGFILKNASESIHKFENFITTTGVKAYELLSDKDITEIIEEKKAFNFTVSDEEELIDVYKKAIIPLKNLKEKIKEHSDAKSFSMLIYNYFEEINLEQVINEYAKEFDNDKDLIKADRFIQVYNGIIESLTKTALILSKEKVDFNTYKNILKINMQNKNIASIPVLCDSLLVTEATGFNNNNYKYVLILGANEGKLPKIMASEAIINEQERNELLKYNFEMSQKLELKIFDEYLKIYDILTSPEENLYISYAMHDINNEELLPSEIVNDLLSLFNKLKVQTENRIKIASKRVLFQNSIENLLSDDKYLKYFKYFLNDEQYKDIAKTVIDNLGKSINQDIKLNKNTISKLLGNEIRGSVSSFEKYRACGFSYYLKYILKSKEKKEFSASLSDIGSLNHLALEEFSKALRKDNLNFSEITDDYIESKLDKIIAKAVKSLNNGIFVSNKRYLFLAKRAKRSLKRTIKLLKLHFIKGDFMPIGFEMSFGENKDLKGFVIDLNDGKKLILNGVIDRVDLLKLENTEYLRIVDYKSGYKTLDFYEIHYGINIQLAVYMLIMLNQESLKDAKPGGILYLTLDEPIISIESPEKKDDIEEKIRKKLIMKGIILNNNEVLNSMDKELAEIRSSDIIDISFDKAGNLNGKNTLTLKEYNKMLENVQITLKDLSENILDGKFNIKPIRVGTNNACAYCPYSSVCCFEKENCSFDDLIKLSKEDIFKEESNE